MRTSPFFKTQEEAPANNYLSDGTDVNSLTSDKIQMRISKIRTKYDNRSALITTDDDYNKLATQLPIALNIREKFGGRKHRKSRKKSKSRKKKNSENLIKKRKSSKKKKSRRSRKSHY